MMRNRRQVLMLWGGALAALAAPAVLRAAGPAVIEMKGTARGEHVWFAPMGLAVGAGTVIRFINRDPGNSHTATAYHPDILDRQRRIPAGAAPWDSGFLLPGQHFDVLLETPGVHDFHCQPHELAGMVGRIVVGRPGRDAGWQGPAADSDDLPEAAMAGFPSVEAILAQGAIMPEM